MFVRRLWRLWQWSSRSGCWDRWRVELRSRFKIGWCELWMVQIGQVRSRRVVISWRLEEVILRSWMMSWGEWTSSWWGGTSVRMMQLLLHGALLDVVGELCRWHSEITNGQIRLWYQSKSTIYLIYLQLSFCEINITLKCTNNCDEINNVNWYFSLSTITGTMSENTILFIYSYLQFSVSFKS